MEFLKSLNWVDILIAALLIRTLYIGYKMGFVIEFMKTVGALTAVFFAFHYYTKLAVFMVHATGGKGGVTDALFQAIAFTLIWAFTVIIIKFVRDGIFLVFMVQTISMFDRWGAVAVAVVRFSLTASMLLFVFLLMDQPYMERMTVSSFSQQNVLFLAPDTYRKITNGFVAKLFPNQKVNTAVTEELYEAGKK
jgi:uncharacterized membrane protein required for colicin V production